MAKPVKPFFLSRMTEGTNRFTQEAKEHQTVHAENVVNDTGDLRRRDAFAGFQHAAPHMLPVQAVWVKTYNYSSQTWTDHADRAPALAYSQLGNTGRLFVGCLYPFQGIDWANLQIDSGSFGTADQQYVRVRFVTSNWSDSADPASDTGLYETAPWVVDTTVRITDSDADKRQPLTKNGMLAWHKSQQPSGWTSTTVDGQSAYWVIIDVSDTPQDSDAAVDDTDYATAWTSGETFTLHSPGIRCFKLRPVTGIFPFGKRADGRFLVSSMSPERYGQETGPQLGWVNGDPNPCISIDVEEDYGIGVFGQKASAGNSTNGNATGYLGWASAQGSANTLTKIDQSYDWAKSTQDGAGTTIFHGSWGYPLLVGDPSVSNYVQPTGTPTATTMTFTYAGSYDTEFNDCVFLCTTSGSGPTIGRYNRVRNSTVSGSSVTVVFTEAWDTAPTTFSRFIVLGIPHRLSCLTKHVDANVSSLTYRPRLEIVKTSNSSAHELDILPTGPDGGFSDDAVDIGDLTLDGQILNFSIGKESRYTLPSNPYPDYCFDEVTRSFVFAFGNYPLCKFDGVRLKRMTALSNPEDLAVQAWTGFVSERTAGDQEDPGYERSATLRYQPPQGKFVTSVLNRLYVAGIPGDPSRVVYSAPGSFNDIWPKGYETLVRNPEGSPITGMNHLNDELVVFTRDSIFASPPPDELGYMSLTPRSQGIGFVNNRVVKRAAFNGASMLIGCNADGIYGYTGAEPRVLMGDWHGIIEGGVNKAAMNRACAEVSYYDNCYYVAVPSQLSTYPDKVVRYCWDDGTIYVWTAPFGGITAMALDRDDNGNEELIFGHEDGTLSRLVPNKTDDGATITGYARTPPFSAGGLTMALTGYMITLENLGDTETVTIKEYPNEDSSDSNDLYAGTFDAGVALDLGEIELLNEKKKTKKVRSKSGTRAETVQLEITGTSQWTLRHWELLMQSLGQRSK